MNAQMTIGKKLMLSFAGLLVLLIGLSFTFLNAVGTLKGTFDTTVDQTARNLSLAGDLDAAESAMLAWQRGMLLYAMTKDTAKSDAAKSKFRQSVEAANRALADISPLLITEEGRRLTESTKSGLNAWTNHFAEIDRICVAGGPTAGFPYAVANTISIHDGAAQYRKLELRRGVGVAVAAAVRGHQVVIGRNGDCDDGHYYVEREDLQDHQGD